MERQTLKLIISIKEIMNTVFVFVLYDCVEIDIFNAAEYVHLDLRIYLFQIGDKMLYLLTL